MPKKKAKKGTTIATGRKRNYRREYDSYHGKPEQRKKRSTRVLARREMEKTGEVKKGDGKEVNHKKPLRSGGTNSKKNLQVMSRAKNRAWRKCKTKR